MLLRRNYSMPVRTIFDPHPDVGCSALAMTPDAKYIAAISAGKNQACHMLLCLRSFMFTSRDSSILGVGDLGLDGRERGSNLVCVDA